MGVTCSQMGGDVKKHKNLTVRDHSYTKAYWHIILEDNIMDLKKRCEDLAGSGEVSIAGPCENLMPMELQKKSEKFYHQLNNYKLL